MINGRMLLDSLKACSFSRASFWYVFEQNRPIISWDMRQKHCYDKPALLGATAGAPLVVTSLLLLLFFKNLVIIQTQISPRVFNWFHFCLLQMVRLGGGFCFLSSYFEFRKYFGRGGSKYEGGWNSKKCNNVFNFWPIFLGFVLKGVFYQCAKLVRGGFLIFDFGDFSGGKYSKNHSKKSKKMYVVVQLFSNFARICCKRCVLTMRKTCTRWIFDFWVWGISGGKKLKKSPKKT